MASPRTSARNRKPKPPAERELAIRMFEVMALMRAVEDRMVTMYRQGELLEDAAVPQLPEIISTLRRVATT